MLKVKVWVRTFHFQLFFFFFDLFSGYVLLQPCWIEHACNTFVTYVTLLSNNVFHIYCRINVKILICVINNQFLVSPVLMNAMTMACRALPVPFFYFSGHASDNNAEMCFLNTDIKQKPGLIL